jgi:spermidine/putrescine transport system ATP-binding protein
LRWTGSGQALSAWLSEWGVDVAELELRGISKRFGERAVLEDISIRVPTGEFHAVLGPSGSGKSTMLRIVGGFTPPDHGRVVIDGRDVTVVPPEKREIGIVFQSYALFPHLSVFENVAFGLRMRRLGRVAIRERVEEALSLVKLEAFVSHKPKHLSGGQQQRCALARALVTRPRVLLLDEPLSALDRKIRHDLRLELKRIQRATGVTTVFVTHDQEEALSLADQLLVLDEGRVRQAGNPWDVYQRPADSFVADFVGSTNLIPAQIVNGTAGLEARASGFSFPLSDSVRDEIGPGTGGRCLLAVRPERVRVADRETTSGEIEGQVLDVELKGAVADVVMEIGSRGGRLRSLLLAPDAERLRVGSTVAVQIDPVGVRVYPAPGPGPKA